MLEIEKELKKGIFVYRLSKLTGISHQVLSALKTGKYKSPSFELIAKIADAREYNVLGSRKKQPRNT